MTSQNQASQYFRQSVQQAVSNHLGDYEVAQQLNHGGYGHVFKIKERKTKRIYAMKVIFRTHKNIESKIKNQINIHQSLKNRYILQMNNKFHDTENYYMILECCEKGDLQTFMLKNYPNFGMPIEEVRKIAQQVAKGISYIHKQDIVHGDIKVNNILINQKDQVKICDFGLSTKRKNKEKVNGAKGTLLYLAPQCILPYDQKVDVWAFGVMLFYLVTGTFPFHIASYKQLTEVLTQQRLKKLQLPNKIQPKLKDLLKKIFVFDPAKRYSIADVLSHPFITGQELAFNQPPAIEEEQPMQRIRGHASTTIEPIRKSDSLKMTLDQNQQRSRYHSKRSRPNSQNKDYDPKKVKDNYMGRILQKKTKMMQKYSDFDKENNINYENVKTQVVRKTQTKFHDKQPKQIEKLVKMQTVKLSQLKDKIDKKSIQPPNTYIQPLNTQGIIIKPIVQKNCITKIDAQGICRIRQQVDEENRKILKEMRISPDGQSVYMKLNKAQKFYRLQKLPEKYFKEYENCKKIVNSVKNHTSKMTFQKKIHNPIYKQIRFTVMYSGKVTAQVNGHKIQTTQKELQEDYVTFAQNGQNFVTQDQAVKHQIKSLYHKLISI